MSPRLPPGYQLRAAEPADCALLPAIERAAGELFRTTGLIDFSDPRALETHSAAEHEAAAREGLLWIVTGPDGPAGFALTCVRYGQLHLEELSVHPAHGRKGLGRALVAQVCRHGAERGLLPVTLSTFVGVPWNRPFYASCGFDMLDESAYTPFHREIRRAEAGFLDIRQRCIMAWDGRRRS